MPEQTDHAVDLPRLAFETYREEYRDLSDTWRNLDAKAQGLGAIAGIFLAALFAWAREVPDDYGVRIRYLIVLSIGLLVASIVSAVLALQVRRVSAPPLGEETASMVRDILHKQKPDELPERIALFYNDQVTAWKDTNEDMSAQCEQKATRLFIGQCALLLSAVLVAVLTAMAVLGLTTL